MWLVKGLKNLPSENFATVNMLHSLKTCTTAFPSYCFITLAKTELENIRLSVSQILRVFLHTSTADDKYFLSNSKNLPQTIPLQLSKKQKYFLNFALHIGSVNQMLNIMKKTMTHIRYVFSKLETAEDMVS